MNGPTGAWSYSNGDLSISIIDNKVEIKGDKGDCSASSNGSMTCKIEGDPLTCEITFSVSDMSVQDVKFSPNKNTLKQGKFMFDILNATFNAGADWLWETGSSSPAINSNLRLDRAMEANCLK